MMVVKMPFSGSKFAVFYIRVVNQLRFAQHELGIEQHTIFF
jgi:hypothetical protein